MRDGARFLPLPVCPVPPALYAKSLVWPRLMCLVLLGVCAVPACRIPCKAPRPVQLDTCARRGLSRLCLVDRVLSRPTNNKPFVISALRAATALRLDTAPPCLVLWAVSVKRALLPALWSVPLVRLEEGRVLLLLLNACLVLWVNGAVTTSAKLVMPVSFV